MKLYVGENRLSEILEYCNSHGESETCTHYGINIESLHRYQRYRKFHETKQPKVLLLDCETSPLQVFAWQLRKQYISHESVIEDSFLICWSAKYLFDATVMSDSLTTQEAIDKNDNRIVNSIWKIMDTADVIIAHNGKKFDLPYLNYRFIMNGLKPPSPYQVIDTLDKVKRHFKFSSNKLDYLGMLIRNKGKIKTDLSLWKGCLEGNQESLDNMVAYNKEDVSLLEEVYLFIRPYIHSHPNMSIYQESTHQACPTCGSVDITECGYYTTMVNRYLAFRCNECGSICRSRVSEFPVDVKKTILRSTAR